MRQSRGGGLVRKSARIPRDGRHEYCTNSRPGPPERITKWKAEAALENHITVALLAGERKQQAAPSGISTIRAPHVQSPVGR